jgi:hypothetical protein
MKGSIPAFSAHSGIESKALGTLMEATSGAPHYSCKQLCCNKLQFFGDAAASKTTGTHSYKQ